MSCTSPAVCTGVYTPPVLFVCWTGPGRPRAAMAAASCKPVTAGPPSSIGSIWDYLVVLSIAYLRLLEV